MLEMIGALIRDLGHLAQGLAGMIVEKIWEPAAHTGNVSDLEAMLQRGRGLLLQGVASILADRLGAALLAGAGQTAGGEALRDALGRIRVGVASDADGTFQRYSPLR
jgi:hypothetical protein